MKLPAFETMPAAAIRAWLADAAARGRTLQGRPPRRLAAALALLAEDRRAAVRAEARRWLRRLEAQAAAEGRAQVLLTLEREAWAAGHRLVAGTDEVGRGPLAGPVVAAAVVLPPGWVPAGLDDSKVLSSDQRLSLYRAICGGAVAVGVGVADVAAIDRVGIHHASLQAMRRAVARLRPAPDALLVDGRHLVPGLGIPQRAIVDGDARSASVAAASVVAKVVRDVLCVRLDAAYPGYGLARHKGYATAEHLAALARLGPAPIHRRRFLAGLGLEADLGPLLPPAT